MGASRQAAVVFGCFLGAYLRGGPGAPPITAGFGIGWRGFSRDIDCGEANSTSFRDRNSKVLDMQTLREAQRYESHAQQGSHAEGCGAGPLGCCSRPTQPFSLAIADSIAAQRFAVWP